MLRKFAVSPGQYVAQFVAHAKCCCCRHHRSILYFGPIVQNDLSHHYQPGYVPPEHSAFPIHVYVYIVDHQVIIGVVFGKSRGALAK